MNTLQLSPVSGVSATAAGGSPAGEAVSSPNSASDTPKARKSVSTGATAAQAAHATAATNATARQAAAAEDQRAAARIETPSLDLSVGLIGGTFDVYVDLTDPTTNRVVARLYGPRGRTAEPAPPAPAKVRTEA